MAGPTETGAYRVAYWGKHKSARYPDWSSVRWGTPLRKQNGEVQVEVEGQWRPLANFTQMNERDIIEEYENLYGARRLPGAWVFNDFGHLTIYLYRDVNGNQRYDAGTEKIHGEFIHSTPELEAATAQNVTVQVTGMDESHGCVHVQPHHIDELVRLGYVKRNTYVHVHSYGQLVVRFPSAVRQPKGPYEIHFYPGIKRLVVVGIE